MANFEFSDRHARVTAVNVGVHSRAGFEFERVCCVIDSPDPRESGINVAHQRLSAALQPLAQTLSST